MRLAIVVTSLILSSGLAMGAKIDDPDFQQVTKVLYEGRGTGGSSTYCLNFPGGRTITHVRTSYILRGNDGSACVREGSTAGVYVERPTELHARYLYSAGTKDPSLAYGYLYEINFGTGGKVDRLCFTYSGRPNEVCRYAVALLPKMAEPTPVPAPTPTPKPYPSPSDDLEPIIPPGMTIFPGPGR